MTLEDRNLGTVSEAEGRGDAHLRQADINSQSGDIVIPVNCGQQMYDVIDITDSRAGLTSEKKRVLGITFRYDSRHGIYRQSLSLGAV